MRSIPPEGLSNSEAVALISDAWDELWSGAGDVIAYFRVLEGMRSRHAVFEGATAHVAELKLLLAGGVRQEAFTDWISNTFPAARGTAPDARRRGDQADTTNMSDEEILSHFEDQLTDAATRASAWTHLKAHWLDLHTKVVSFGGRGAIAALAAVSDRQTRDDIAGFFTTRTPAGAERTLRQTLERIDGRIAFREREQQMFDSWLTRQMSPSIAAEPRLRHAHALLNMLAAGFHGALVHRSWLEGLGLAAPSWMQPAVELAQVVTALDQRLVAIFHGAAVIDAPLLALSERLQEDLRASSEALERLLVPSGAADDTTKGLAAVLARQAAMFERLLRGAITFTDLFGDDHAARVLRRRLASTDEDRARLRSLLEAVASRNVTDETGRAIRQESTSLPALQRSQAADLAALVNAAAANPPRPRERDS